METRLEERRDSSVCFKRIRAAWERFRSGWAEPSLTPGAVECSPATSSFSTLSSSLSLSLLLLSYRWASWFYLVVEFQLINVAKRPLVVRLSRSMFSWHLSCSVAQHFASIFMSVFTCYLAGTFLSVVTIFSMFLLFQFRSFSWDYFVTLIRKWRAKYRRCWVRFFRDFVGSEVKCFEHSGRFVVGYVSINEITAVNSVYR